MFLPLGYYSVSGLVNFFTSLTISLLVLIKRPSATPNRIFSIFSALVAFWSFFYFLALNTKDAKLAELYFRTCMIGVVFMPSTFVHFVLTFLQRRGAAAFHMVNYALSALFAATIYTPLFALGMRPHLIFPHWGIPGLIFPLHLLHFGANVMYAHFLMFQEIRRTRGVARNQIFYVFAGTGIGFIAGSTNYLSWYQAPMPPILNPLISLYVLSIAYAIVRYRLLDINLAITRTVVFAAVYALILGLPLVGALAWQQELEQFFGHRWWVWLWIASAGLATMAHYVNLYIQQRAESRLLREQRQYQTTLMSAAKGMVQMRDLSRLLNLTTHLLTRAMKLTHAGVFLLEKETGNYILKASRDRDVLKVGLLVKGDDALITWLKDHREPLVAEEVKQWPAHKTNGTVPVEQLVAHLRRLETAVIIPSFTEDVLLGFLVLGEKRTGAMYSQDDLNVLQALANQAALALQNAQFYEELQHTTAQLIHNSKLTAMGKMASGMSHQIHNRLYVLTIEAGVMRLQLLKQLRLPNLPEAERQRLLDELEKKVESIEEESMKGSTIVKTLLQFSKPTMDMKVASIDEIVQGGLQMVGLKRDLTSLAITVEVPERLPNVKVNIPQLQDVIFNLVDNAYDAIELKADKLRLGLLSSSESYQQYRGAIRIVAAPSPDGKKVLLTVADDGMGMSAEEQEQLFLPFHTTKATAEKGSGLGLFVIREILKSHGGIVQLESSHVGKGTTFLLELPVAETRRT